MLLDNNVKNNLLDAIVVFFANIKFAKKAKKKIPIRYFSIWHWKLF